MAGRKSRDRRLLCTPVLLLSLPLPPGDSRVSRKVSSGTWTRDSPMPSRARLCGAVTTAATVSGGRGRSPAGEVAGGKHISLSGHPGTSIPSNPALHSPSHLRPHLPSVSSSQLQEATRLARQPPLAQDSSASSSLSLRRQEGTTVSRHRTQTPTTSCSRTLQSPSMVADSPMASSSPILLVWVPLPPCPSAPYHQLALWPPGT